MRKAILLLTVMLLLLNVSGCGYFSSGTWTDDPDNWERAFQLQKPEDVVVVHSQYWRSPHFTYEYRYFFEIAANEELEQQLFTENDLILWDNVESWDVADVFYEAPDWFVTKSLENYEVYQYQDEVNCNLLVFVERESRTIYLADYQY